jgi:hypothetical protein
MSGPTCRACRSSANVVVVSAPCAGSSATVGGRSVAFAGEVGEWSVAYCARCNEVISRPALATAPDCRAGREFGAIRKIKTVSLYGSGRQQ